MLSSISSAADWPSATVRPNPHRTRPQSDMNAYRHAAVPSSVTHVETLPHRALRRPRPMSIAAKTASVSGVNRRRESRTSTAATIGPAKAIQPIGEALTASAGSNSCMNGRRPTIAARPAAMPTAANLCSTAGPEARSRTRARATSEMANTGARRRTANPRLSSIAPCSTARARTTRRAVSRSAATAMRAMATRPTPPRSKRMPGWRAGPKTTAKTSEPAAPTRRTAASGCIGLLRGDEGDHHRDGGARQEDLESRWWRTERPGERDREGDRRGGAQAGGPTASREDSRPHHHDRDERAKAQAATLSGHHGDGDPQSEDGRRYAEDQPPRGAWRHHLPAGRAGAPAQCRGDKAANQKRHSGDRPRHLQRDAGQADGRHPHARGQAP